MTRHWRTSVGVKPFSDIGYNIVNSEVIDDIGSITYTYSGKGGLNQLYWGNAFKICKGLSIGLNVSYMFGSVYSYSKSLEKYAQRVRNAKSKAVRDKAKDLLDQLRRTLEQAEGLSGSPLRGKAGKA